MPEFFSGTTELKNIDASVFKKEYWTDSDDTKQKMMAGSIGSEQDIA